MLNFKKICTETKRGLLTLFCGIWHKFLKTYLKFYMKKYFINACVLGFMMVGLTSCEIITDIFTTGMWLGVVLVMGVIFLIFYLLNKSKK